MAPIIIWLIAGLVSLQPFLWALLIIVLMRIGKQWQCSCVIHYNPEQMNDATPFRVCKTEGLNVNLVNPREPFRPWLYLHIIILQRNVRWSSLCVTLFHTCVMTVRHEQYSYASTLRCNGLHALICRFFCAIYAHAHMHSRAHAHARAHARARAHAHKKYQEMSKLSQAPDYSV